MAKRYKTLQKKLEGLKSHLSLVILSTPHSEDADRQLLAAEIEQRLLFVNRLLTAEVASSPTNPSSRRHLRRIARTIESLESDFNEWEEHCEISRAADEAISGSEDDTSNVRSDYVLGTGDQVCFRVREGLVDVDVKLEPEKAAERGGATVAVCKEEKGGGKIGSYFGGLMTGMVFGMILVCLDHISLPHCHAYLFPT